MNHNIRGLAAAVVAVGTMTMPTLASDPLGAFCIVEKVVLEPGDCPVRAQVWGACAVANPANGRFEKAARGYFYYSVPTGKEEIARAEWMDLKASAGTGAVVGFGGRRMPIGRFRAENENPAAPDAYPLNTGVVKLTDYFARDMYSGVADQLRALIRK
ncbi:MAG TPA: hypothetical protein VES67_17580 [Vicinamibacterales bacterium]|nr:hypothetical protein [Vicinamibacterales bacterium]